MSYLSGIFHPEYFQGSGRTKRYFEGWYFKHEMGDSSFALIPGISLTADDAHAFIQLILFSGAQHETRYFRFPLSAFQADRHRLFIKIGENTFSSAGVSASLEQGGFSFSCKVRYGVFTHLEKTPIRPGIMGIFSYLPGMECRHGVISLFHTVEGEYSVHGSMADVSGGLGYIEKDWGRSFPSGYLWLQCENFGVAGTSFMLSSATIPFLGGSFHGLICVFLHEGKQYFFATYNRAKLRILEQTPQLLRLCVVRGSQSLYVEARSPEGGELAAPVNGEMSRKIKEGVCCTLSLRFRKHSRVVFEGEGRAAGFEQSELRKSAD